MKSGFNGFLVFINLEYLLLVFAAALMPFLFHAAGTAF